MTSKTTTAVPAQVVVPLREALYTDLQRACEDAPDSAPEYKTRRGWTPVLRRITATVGSLDVIGWEEPAKQLPLMIALNPTMVAALEADAEHWEWLSEQVRTESAQGRARAAELAAMIERFLGGLAERPAVATLMIPTVALALVRECAHEAWSDISEAIDGGVYPRECARRLRAVCDLLDLIGWSEDEEPSEDVDAIEHASAVKEVARRYWRRLTTAVGELRDGDPEKVKAENELRLLSDVHAQACAALGG
jgi:hypothetical protein